MSKKFLHTFRRTLLMLARRNIILNLSIYQTQQNDIDKFKSWMDTQDDEYCEKLELFNAYKRGVDITGYIPFFTMTENEFENLYSKMRSNRENWTFEYRIMKGEKSDSSIDDKNMLYSFLYPKSDRSYCFVYFADSNEQSISDGIIKNCLTSVIKMRESVVINDIIIISSKNLSPQAKKSIATFGSDRTNIQIFNENEISIDPFDNIWNSDIKIYTETETEKFLKENNLVPSQLPRRPINDLQLKYLGCRENLIIEIKRTSYIPETLVRVELTHAYTYYKSEEKPRSVKKKQISEIL